MSDKVKTINTERDGIKAQIEAAQAERQRIRSVALSSSLLSVATDSTA